ncbi:MAG TPA: adenylate/guanylate cyclase domain-containing protein [Acidimicrobiia bacterium]
MSTERSKMAEPAAARRSLLQAIAAMAAGADEVDERRLRRTLLFMLAGFSSVAGIVWGSIYLVFGEWQAAVLPFAYTALSAPSLVLGRRIQQLERLIWSQLVLITAIPFLLAWVLGGFVGSGAVILWALLGPVGAFLISGRSRAKAWLYVYLALVLLLWLLAPQVTPANDLPSWVILAFFVLNVGSVSAIAFGLLYHFVGENRRVLELLRLEKDKSERLLLNILPKEVADVLRDEGQTIAEKFDDVSILFADVVGFTPMSESMPAEDVVRLLNTLYSRFDELVEHYGVEKIRTIGDNYMVVAGAPRRRPNHAHALASMALDMMGFLDDFVAPNGSRLQFRIGINSGPVVAGVIGTAKFQYDVWGDAVNLASRMESHGVPGRIQIGPTTYEMIRDDFHCVARGTIDVKGKGEVPTWFVEDGNNVQR